MTIVKISRHAMTENNLCKKKKKTDDQMVSENRNRGKIRLDYVGAACYSETMIPSSQSSTVILSFVFLSLSPKSKWKED